MCIPFNSKEFLEAWELWKKHKQEISKWAYTPTAEDTALSNLFLRCHGREQLAIEAINLSIEKNWANIYPPKLEYGKQGNTATGQTGIRGAVSDELNRRYGNGG